MTIALHEALTQIAPYLCETNGAKHLSIQPANTAGCNRVFKIVSGNQTLALRLNHSYSEALGIDRSVEHKILTELQSRSWAPKLIAANNQWLLTQWHPSLPAKMGKATCLNLLAKALTQIHQINTDATALNVSKRIQQGLAKSKQLEPTFKQQLIRLCQSYRFPSTLSLCHHDWHPGNLLVHRENWMLLDWEFAALGDPMMDIASACLGFQLSHQQSRQLANLLQVDPAELMRSVAIMQGLNLVWYDANPQIIKASGYTQADWLQEWA